LRNLADERNPLYEDAADYIVDTDDQSARAVANQIIVKIGL
jgi:shikimate kinase